MAKATRVKHLSVLLNLTRFYHNQDWQSITKQDVTNIVAEIMTKYSDNGQETNTTWDHKKILKIFVRWVKTGSREFKEVGNPEEIKGTKLKKVKDKIAREQLITEDDRTKLLFQATNPRDRVLIDVQFEAGTRPGELLSLKIKHLIFDDYGAIIKVDGKTGSRPVRLVKSVPSLLKWYYSHPFRLDQEAPLWCGLTKQNYGTPLTYQTVRQILRRLCHRANLSKRVYLNLFRHSEATTAATFMTEAQMKLRHGWTKESKMPARYTHLLQSDVEAAILDHFGVTRKEKEKPKQNQVCAACRFVNTPDVEFCESCGKALSLEAAIRQDAKKDETIFTMREQIESLRKQQKT
ncbi:MAG: tyrosine-type recombinase/integrase [Candidatus Nitrosotenuis sp.]